MRLIYANDVKKRGDCYPPIIRKAVANILSHTRTVKDAELVVRCKDCKLFDKEHEGGIGSCALEMNVAENDFCSKAERKDEVEG